MDAETAVQQAADANAAMGCAPDDLTNQLPPTLSAVASAATSQFDLGSILKRLEGFMKLANLAAEVCVLFCGVLTSLIDLYLSRRCTRLLNSLGGSYQWHIK